MVKTILKNSSIKGISCVVPSKECSLTDDSELYGGDQRRIQRVINSSGFLKRRIADKNITTADLCEQAALKLFESMRISPETIDGLLFLSYTPDYLMPATSYVLHHKLGLSNNCVVMDIPQACSGFVVGLYQASLLLNGGCRRVLLLVGDTFSKFSDMFKDHSAPVFGDAGTATLLEYDENSEPMFFDILSDGNNYDALICENGGFRNPPKKEDFYEDGSYKYSAKMDGGRIFDFTLQKIYPQIAELLAFASIEKNEIDYFVLHQANKFILENIARLGEIEKGKIPMSTLTKYGNQCGASIPCAIADKIQTEVISKKLKLLLCGFGVGLNWASAIINTEKIYCSGIDEFN